MSKTMNIDEILEAVVNGAGAEMSTENPDEFIKKASKDLGRDIKRPKEIPTEVAEKAMRAHGEMVVKVLEKVSEQMCGIIDDFVEFEKNYRKRMAITANLLKLAKTTADAVPIIAKSDDGDDDAVNIKVAVKDK